MTSRPILIAIAVLTVIIVIVSIFIINPNNQQQNPQSEQSIEACRDFEALEHPIGCQEAVSLALEQAPGKVQKVSIGPIRTSIPSESGAPERRIVDMWFIDIELTTPYKDEESFGDREISFLQIGIRVDENNIIYRKPLQ